MGKKGDFIAWQCYHSPGNLLAKLVSSTLAPGGNGLSLKDGALSCLHPHHLILGAGRQSAGFLGGAGLPLRPHGGPH